MRRAALLSALLIAVSGCGEDLTSAPDPTTTAPSDATAATTTSAATTTTAAPTTSAAPATTQAPFEAPPTTEVNPEMTALSGLWRWSRTHTRYLQLQDHGAIAVGSVVDDVLQLHSTGRWTISDGMLEIQFLEIGGTCDADAVGVYDAWLSSGNLRMTLVADECANRATWLIGLDRTSRTWLRADP